MDQIIGAGQTKTPSNLSLTLLSEIILCFSIGATFISLIVSIYLSTEVIANIWKLAKDMFGVGFSRGFFHAGFISKTYQNYEAFTQAFNEQTPKELIQTGLGELWVTAKQHDRRYQFLRYAIIFLLLSTIPLVISMLTFLFSFKP